MTAQDEEARNRDPALCGIGEWKDQLHMYFTQFTKDGSRAALMVRGGGLDKACKAWGKLADAGFY